MKFSLITLVLAVPLVFCTVSSTSWYRNAWKKAATQYFDVGVLGGKEVMVVALYVPVLIVALCAIICGAARLPHCSLKLPGRLSSQSYSDLLAFTLYALVQLGWVLARVERGSNFGVTLGLCAMVNLQVFLIPVSRLSPFMQALHLAPESAVRYHRFLGWATLWLTLGHFAWFVVVWSVRGVLVQKLFSMTGDIRIFPGVLAFLVSVPLFITSIPWVRRQYSYEVFIHTHRVCALLFAVCVTWHFPGIPWWCVPSLLLYLSDHASQLKSWGNVILARRVRSTGGVFSIALPCSGVPRPEPLQWVCLQAPDLSLLQWHPVTVASSRDSEFTITMKVFPDGWTGALSAFALEAEQLRMRIAGPYGLPHTFEDYDRGRPLLMIAGGSGGTPFMSLLQAISQRPCSIKQAAVMLVWVFRTEKMMGEYIHQTGMQEVVAMSSNVTIRFFVTNLNSESCPMSMLGEPSEKEQREFHEGSAPRRNHDNKLIVVLCHILVPIGALLALHHGATVKVHGGWQFVYLLAGALVAAVLSHILAEVPRAVMSEYRPRRPTAAARSTPHVRDFQLVPMRKQQQQAETPRQLPVLAAACPASSGAPGSEVEAPPHASFNFEPGRPDLGAVLSEFEEQCGASAAGDFGSQCVVMASGPPPLVSAARGAARARGCEFEALSFDL